MGESSSYRHTIPPSRLGPRSSCGEIVEVQGGHIVRSTGRKDRHSKVCTAKGPRDRRVRLAAHTAIQFYDVQDRLGYDRPSKAVDWLIKKAKSAIDELAQLPPWHPTSCSSAQNVNFEQEEGVTKLEEENQQEQQQLVMHHSKLMMNSDISGSGSGSGSSSKRPMMIHGGGDEQQGLHHQSGGINNPCSQNMSFLPPSLDSDAIADTIKSFFPMGASVEASSSSMQFQNFPTPDLLSRNSGNNQDLRLSLQSFQDPILLHHQPQQHQNITHHSDQAHQQGNVQAQILLSGTPLGFDGTASWAEYQQAAELSRFHRLTAWNSGGNGGDTNIGSGGAAASFLFNSPVATQQTLQQLLGHTQFSSQRGPLQSSITPSIRAWMDASGVSIASADPNQQHHLLPTVFPIYPSSMQGIGFASGVGGFPGFHIPARIQGEEEEHDGYSDKPSSASSDSRH